MRRAFVPATALFALMLVLFGGKIADLLAGNFGFGNLFIVSWKVVQWPIVLAFMLLAFALIYYLAPDLDDQRWIWITPGSVAGVGLWLLVSFGFKIYLHFFNSYSNTYGRSHYRRLLNQVSDAYAIRRCNLSWRSSYASCIRNSSNFSLLIV